MPQIFQVLKCYKCSVFQIHQTKKSNKFECKMCGEKQSIKRHYGIGSGKDCRIHVQRLNSLRGDMEAKCNIQSNSDEEYGDSKIDDKELENISSLMAKPIKRSKWSEYVDVEETEATEEPMFLGDIEVMLEIPQKKKINNMKFKTKSTNSGVNSCNPLKTSEIELKSNRASSKKSDIETKNISQDNILNNKEISSRKWLSNNNISNVIEDLEKPTEYQTINGNSKWAQFIDTNESSDVNIDVMTNNNQDESGFSDVLLNCDVGKNCSRTVDLFSQCDDIELDQVLNI